MGTPWGSVQGLVAAACWGRTGRRGQLASLLDAAAASITSGHLQGGQHP